MEQNVIGQNPFGFAAQGSAQSATQAGNQQEWYMAHAAGSGDVIMNMGNRDRILSLVVGAVGLIWLGKRLFTYGALAALSVYMLYRGLTGFCAIYARAHLDTRGRPFPSPVERAPIPSADEPSADEPVGGETIAADEQRDAEAIVSDSGLPVAAIWVEHASATKGPRVKNRPQPRSATPPVASESVVDEASKQSFPASDPPAF
jgi:hypothetical protein